MRELALKYEDSNVLVVGGNGSDCRHVAEHYGFKHVVTPEEVHSVFPSVCPSSVCEARSIPLAEVIGRFFSLSYFRSGSTFVRLRVHVVPNKLYRMVGL